MIPVVEGSLDVQQAKVALVVARFNERVTAKLLAAAEDCLQRHGCAAEARTVVRVPGAWEVALAAHKLAGSGRFDGIVALGALIRGQTTHFDVLAAETARGLARTALDSGIPVTFGVLTTDTVEQALERAGGKAGNKGWEATLAVLEMIDLYRRLA